MTFAEMKSRARILFEEITSGDAPGFTNADWGQIFTQAQYDVVNDILQDGLAKNAYNRRALDALIKYQEFTDADAGPTITAHPKYTYGYLVDIENTAIGLTADQIWWILSAGAEVTSLASTTVGNIPIDEINYSEYRANIKNPFRKPSYEYSLWYWPEDKKLVVITDGSVLKKVLIEYVENLKSSTTDYTIASGSDCKLHESVHPLIVKRAVETAFSAVQDQAGFQMQVLENQNPPLP